MIGEALGPYRIERELGSGGMGRVYAAVAEGAVRGVETGARVALKVVHSHLLETAGFFKRFLREGAIGATVRHENVVRTFDCEQLVVDGKTYAFLVMEYVEGQTLRELLVELDRVPEELCRHIGREVSKGLGAIHAAGVVHRDMKPDNVLITADHVVKIMDLGVARSVDDALKLSQTGAFVGSIHYAAPEQFRGGGRDLDGRLDLHALGLVLYELSCGANPYLADDVPQILRKVLHEQPRRLGDINPQLSPFFEEVVHTLLSKPRDERFADADELLRVLEQGEDTPWWRARAKAIRVETQRPLRRIRIPRETSVYGRDKEISKLRGLFEKAKAGDGQIVLIEGEAGIGKSRVVDELIGRLRRDGEDLNFLFGSYPPGGAATAAGAFSSAYREHFGEAGLEATLRGYLTTTPTLVPAFAALLTGGVTPGGQEPLSKDSLQTVFVHATRSLAAERPTIVLIDDLHFAPDEGRALFAALATAVAAYGILLVGTTRPGLSEDWVANLERLEHSSHLELNRMGPKDLMQLLEDSLRSKRLAEKLGHQIATKSDGNPFFVFEIIRGLRDGQFITQQEDGSWISTKVIEEIQIPASVRDLIHARIADLSEDEKEMLDVASCCGFEFDPILVGETLGMGRIPLLRTLGRIEKSHRLVRASGRRFVFDHHQVQEALYAGLSQLLSEEYHAALAETLESRENAAEKDPKELLGATCVDLCEHYFKGARGECGIRYLDAALGHLEAGYMNAQVVVLADRALDVGDLVKGAERVELLLRKALRLSDLGSRDDERAALDEALTLAEKDGEPVLHARVESALGSHLLRLARYEESQEFLSRALDRARGAGAESLEARVTGQLGTVLHAQARYDEAHEYHARYGALARKIGDRSAEATAAGNLGSTLQDQGRYDEARQQLGRQMALAREIGDRRGETAATANLGNLFWGQGRYEEARAHLERSRALAREIGYRQAEVITTGNLGAVSLARGRFEEARQCFEQQLALTREMGYRRGEGFALVNIGPLLVAMGRPEEGRERLLECLAVSRAIGAPQLEASALDGLGVAAESLGDVDTAEQRHREALALRREIGSQGGVPSSLETLGAFLAANGREEEAIAVLTEAHDTAREVGVPGERVLARCRLALLPGGDATAARATFDDFADELDMHETMDARFLLWKAGSDPDGLSEARRLLQHLCGHVPEEWRDAMIANVPLHREIAAAAKEQRL